MNSYFKVFMNWLFDGNINSQIPKEDLKNNIPDILSYKSPITCTYVINLFIKCLKINNYLDEYFNNINLRYLDKKELFYFIKELVIKNNIKRYQLHYTIYKPKNKLYDLLREKIPYLKNDEILLLCDKIDKLENKDDIYNSLGIIEPKKEKIKKINQETISLKDFINRNFSILKI